MRQTMAEQLERVGRERERRAVTAARKIAKNRRIKIWDEPCGCTVRFITAAEMNRGRLAGGKPIPHHLVRMVEGPGGTHDPAITLGVCDWHKARPWWSAEFLQARKSEPPREITNRRTAEVLVKVTKWRGQFRVKLAEAKRGVKPIAEAETEMEAMLAAMRVLRAEHSDSNLNVKVA